MSLPRELLDQLLSGYLDDALSADERARVDQLVQSDDEIAKELDQLREIKMSLKAISAADSAIKLDKGFSDRVLGAAVARAHAEGLGDDHPLVRLAEQPSTTRAGAGHSGSGQGPERSRSLRVAGLLVGLAASIVIAVIALRSDSGTIAQNQQNQLIPGGLAEAESTPPVDPAGTPESIAIEDPAAVPSPEMIAASDPADPGLVNANSLELESSDPVSEPVVSPDSRMEKLEQPEPGDAIAKTPDSIQPTDSIQAPRDSNIDVLQLAIGPVLVIDVRRTEAGRNSDPIADALAYAKIEPANEKTITDEIAGFAKSNSVGADENASILYLQVPGKKADLFYLSLMQDVVGIESVGLRFAMDAPITKMVNAIRPDPTQVKHDGAALKLFSDGGTVDQFTNHLGQLEFLPQNRTELREKPKLTAGPDISAHILVLVR